MHNGVEAAKWQLLMLYIDQITTCRSLLRKFIIDFSLFLRHSVCRKLSDSIYRHILWHYARR